MVTWKSCDEDFLWRMVDWAAPFWQLLSALERLCCLHPLAIIARKRLDISFCDCARAMRLCLLAMLPGGSGDGARERASVDLSSSTDWAPARVNTRRLDLAPASGEDSAAPTRAAPAPAAVAPFLSVRTAFDLYLKALKLPRGSLVVCSALTIPDMVTIFEEHGLVPVPVDLDPATLAPEVGALEAEVERCRAEQCGGGAAGRVRAIYVAHVFGAVVDMTPAVHAAALHGLLVWEDCAQVFTGRQAYLGHPESDAVFFSFGVIKRATALGGGVARIGNTAVLSAMRREEADYPAQSAGTYLQRVLKYTLLLALTSPLLYGVIVYALGLMGVDHDKLAMKISKGFPKKGLLKAIRHRPSVPLLQMLGWRTSRYNAEGVEIRLRHCNRMLGLLEVALARGAQTRGVKECQELASGGVEDVLPGTRAHRHTLWLYPVVVRGGSQRANSLVDALLREGFDATRAPTSLMSIDRCTSAERTGVSGWTTPLTASSKTPRCSSMMSSLVYLPLCNNIPDSEMDRMTLTLARELLRSPSSRNDCRVRAGVVSGRGNGMGHREVAKIIISFAFRLDVIVLSISCAVILVPLLLLAHVL